MFINIPDGVAISPTWKDPAANFAALPLVGNSNGDVRETLDTHTLWIWNGSSWQNASSGIVGSLGNLILVSNISGGQFTSVASALASITTNSSSNPFTILIGPGVYPEPQLVMKSFVSITSNTNQEAVLVAIDPSSPFIIGADNSSITNLIFTGATDPGGVLIQYTGGANSTSFLVKDCVFGNAETLCYAKGNSSFETIFIIQNCISFPDVEFTDGFKVDASGGIRSRFVLSGLFINTGHSLTNPEDFIECSGDGSKVLLSDSFFIGPFSSPAGNALHLFDGADVTAIGSNFINMSKVIWVENIGIESELAITGVHTDSNINDIVIEHPNTVGSIEGAFQASNSIINSNLISILFADPTGGVVLTGNLFQGNTFSNTTNVSSVIQDQTTSGALDPTNLTASGLNVTVQSGDGYLQIGPHPNNILKYVQWPLTVLSIPINSVKFIYVDATGTVLTSSSVPDDVQNVFLGQVVSDSSSVYIIKEIASEAFSIGNQFDDFLRNALGPVYQSGSIVTENATPRHLNVSSGIYYFSTHVYAPVGGTNINFIPYFRDGSGGYTKDTTTNSLASSSTTWKYDNGSGTLALIPGTNYVRHALYLVGDGVDEKYLFVYGQVLYTTLVSAEGGNTPTPPTFFNENVVLIASIIIQQTQTNVTEILDERPVIGFKASGVSATAIHGNLLGLLADDHPQYVLTNGSRVMTGSLQVGTISNQLKLSSSTNLLTLNSGTSAAARTYTIPDVGTTGNFILDAGTQSIGGSKTFTSTVTINAGSNQLNLGSGANLLTINGDGSTAARTYTVPDGGVTADFVISEGASTLAGTRTFSTAPIISSFSTAGIIHNNSSGLLSSSLIINADVSASAAITYSKLNLSNSVVNADINSSAAIAYSKLNLSNSIVNADINSSAAIAYSKLNLSNSIVNADINSAANIAISKLTSGSANQFIRENNGATSPIYVDLLGTSNQVIVTNNAGNTTLSLPQSIATSSSPTFASLTLTSPLTATNGGTGVSNSFNLTIGGTSSINGTFSGTSSGTNTGDITLSAVGSSPNANAASLSSQVLNLQPASASFPGVITTGTQTIAGNKTFSGNTIDTSVEINGTGGNGFLQLDNQSSTPSTPTSSFRLYADSTSRLTWVGTNGFTRTFDGTSNTANRIYTLPDVAGTFDLNARKSYTNTTISSATTTIASTDAFAIYLVDTTAARTINLPTATSVGTRSYIFKDISGTSETNNITFVPNGTDQIEGLNVNRIWGTNYGSLTFVSDGSSKWWLV